MSTVPETLQRFRPTYAEIDLDAFASNIDSIRTFLPDGSRLIAVLKGDGYGHGAVPLAKVCSRHHVAMIAVSLLEEAIELHNAAIDCPILILGPLTHNQISIAADLQFSIGITGPEELGAVCSESRQLKKPIRIHVKLDSGMGRMGLVESDLPRVSAELRHAPFVQLDAIYTHFANASDPSDPYTETQIVNFTRMIRSLRDAGIHAPLHHLANSAATVRKLAMPGDFVRVGISLYGGEPLDLGETRLLPMMRWCTRVARLKTLPPGHGIGYATTFKTARETLVATLPVGYADGYNRLLSNNAEVLIRGKRCPVLGRVSMDLITVDVTDLDDVRIGDEVVLMGHQGKERISAEEIAARIGTISYEVFCAVSSRVPRVYESGGQVVVRSRFD